MITNVHLPNIILEAQILHQGNQRLDDDLSFLTMIRLARGSFDLLCSILSWQLRLYDCYIKVGMCLSSFAQHRYLLLIAVQYSNSLFYECVSSAIYEANLAIFPLNDW